MSHASPRDAVEALAALKEGNRRFISGEPAHPFTVAEREASLAGQRPFAVIVGCSDARVPVEAVFNAGAGDLFVVRTAGHVLAAASLASIRYAIEMLDAPLIVVLGHEDCGAVSAALADESPEWLAPILDHICVKEVVGSAPSGSVLAAAVDHHVIETVTELEEWISASGISPRPTVVGGAFQLASGAVHWFE